MNILKKFFALYFAFCWKQYNEYNALKLKTKFNQIGSDAQIQPPFKLVGGQYISIGEGFYCGAESRIEAWDYYEPANQVFTPHIIIGNDVRINGKCHIGAIQSIVIKNHVLLGNGVFITDHAHGDSSPEQAGISPNDRPLYSKGPVEIGSNVWICEGAVILPGVTIGESCIIAANAVVTHSIPPFSVAAGVPAKVVKRLEP